MRHAFITVLLFSLASCRESTPTDPVAEPKAQPAKVEKLTAVSPTAQTLIAGSNVERLPSVRATDAQGKAVSGVIVVFLLNGGVTRVSFFTDGNGVATLASWTISKTAGFANIVTASAPGIDPVMFTVKGIAGPAFQIESLLQDEQLGFSDNVLAPSPAVRVLDKYGNAVAGEAVRFEGTGSANPASALTDSLGIARTQWTLGREMAQMLTATSGELEPVTFRARAYNLTENCATVIRMPVIGQLQSSLGNPACQVNGKYQQTVVMDLSGPIGWRFAMSSADFKTAIELRDMKGGLIGRSDGTSSGNSTLRAILPSGLFQLILTSTDANAQGRYAIQFGTASTAADCGEVFVARGLTLPQQTYSICPSSPYNRTVDSYRLNLEAGAAIQLQLDDRSYDDPSIELRNDKGEVVARGKQSGSYVDLLDFIPAVGGIYTIVVTAGDEEFIVYTLAIR